MKKIELKLWKILLLTLLLGAGAAYLTSTMVRYHREVDSLRTGLKQSEKRIHTYGIVVDDLKEVVAETRLKVVNRDAIIGRMVEYSERLEQEGIRNVYAIGKLNATVSALKDSLIVTGNDTVAKIVYIHDTIPAIELPLFFESDDDWLYLYGDVSRGGVGSLGMYIKDMPINVTLGSRGVLRKDYVSAVSTPNPYLSIDESNFTLVHSKNKTPYLVAGGFTLGVVATTGLMLLLGSR